MRSSAVAVLAMFGWIGRSVAWVGPRTIHGTASADRLPRPHYVDALALSPSEAALPRAIRAAAGGLASVMAPLFAANAAAFEGNQNLFQSQTPLPQPPQLADLKDIFSNALENLDGSILHPSDLNERIATSIVTAVNERGVATNPEMYAIMQQGWNNLVAALEKLDGLSVEEKTAAVIATIVLSYPVSYEYYKYEQAEEERKAKEKRAAMALKKKQAAAAKKKKSPKKTTANKAAKTKAPKKAIKGTIEKVSAPQRNSGPKGSPSPQTRREDVGRSPPEIRIPEEARVVVTMDKAIPAPSVVAAAPPPLGGQPAPGSPPSDGGMDAYAQAYASMIQQSTLETPAVSIVATKASRTPSPAATVKYQSVVVAPISATASYLDTLSP